MKDTRLRTRTGETRVGLSSELDSESGERETRLTGDVLHQLLVERAAGDTPRFLSASRVDANDIDRRVQGIERAPGLKAIPESAHICPDTVVLGYLGPIFPLWETT